MPVEESIFVTAQDGLRLHVRSHGVRNDATLPVVCLPGLTRTCADFEPLATTFAGDTEQPRWVIALDYRGRGQSDYDPDPANYNVTVELADVLTVLAALGISQAVFIGTSRGGILSMLLAATAPAILAGVVLNDIGPVIDSHGLMRIKGYVGRSPNPETFEDAAESLRRLFAPQFPKLSPDDWMAFARRSFQPRNGRLEPTYDVRLAGTLDGVDLDHPLPSLWPQFDALAEVPVMVIHGTNSDLLSVETVAAMQLRRPDLEIIEVVDQGHAPLLAEQDVIQRVGAFVGRCERACAKRQRG